MSRRVAVIGGGASGMMAAITAAGEGADVTLYERNDRLGKKILATGNGKCNLSNEEMSGEKYHSGDNVRVQQWLEIFGVAETVAFFNRLGLMIRDRNGYLYPASEQASSVLDVLRIALVQAGVQVVTEIKINRIISRKGKVEIGWDNQSCTYDSAVIACGSKAAPKTGSDGSGYKLARQLGIAQTPVVPALVQLICREEYCKAIAGVRTDAQICVFSGKERTACERGELQLTEYGISGIPVFQLSGAVNYQLRVEKELRAEIDFFPGMSDAQYEEFAEERIKTAGIGLLKNFLQGCFIRN